MFHKASDLKFKNGTVLEVTFQDGNVKEYDIAVLFDKFPQLKALRNRRLFLSGRLSGGYGIIWTDELDLEVETVYEEGVTVRRIDPEPGAIVGNELSVMRCNKELSQKQLSEKTGIDQSDLSKIERGASNPSIGTLKRIADALDCNLIIRFEPK